ncbi:nuclear pore complex protein Nup93-like protein [Dinothrombium tinctorium]|uniref:Nuclear pore protein n=1 Tax=Dinothrombium tinctorium TaxID=1965070 RepID=A0A3S3PE64_9ACAR|nr:nuclear pore complex protein Nup93-like protein [Dinothrombium tinctorium]RWS10549.1 nuclear pore complex protein Nup93-like protein [Dinothrombium tinctorium]RWS13232.1 nuclear pore complex protein Nup93-like protein [Dinothrombium tinctorium]RWS16699.1 nuclear pore complex protein Nup93-like protein [Dinothrombium tinctorium]
MEGNAFEDLLFKAEQLTAEIDGVSQLPRIERNLKQLSDAGQELWSRTAFHRQRETSDVRASVLLGSKGYDLQKVSQNLENLSAVKKVPAVEAAKHSDIQGLLRHERENAILSVIEEVKNSTFNAVDKKCSDHMLNEWEEYKVKMMNSLTALPRETGDVGAKLDTPVKFKSFVKSPDSSDLRQKSIFESPGLSQSALNISMDTLNQFKGDVESVISQVAVGVKDHVVFEAAFKLLSESKNSKDLTLLNKHLSTVVSEKRGVNVKRDQLEALALRLAEFYCSNEHSMDKEVVGTLYLLLDLMIFFDYYHNSLYNDAYDIMVKLKLLPFRILDVELKVNEFGQYAEEIRRNIADVLIATMKILYHQYKEITSSSQTVTKFGILSDSNNKQQQCAEIREKARALITYAGMIPYRMPGDTSARLVQLEVLMN